MRTGHYDESGHPARMSKKNVHAVALFSGGLDSCLAVLLMLRQGIEVTALSFMTHFGCDLQDRSSCSHNPYPAAEKFGFSVKLMQLGQKFIDIVREPHYGRGKNMNPCVDCRILMLSEAKEYMEAIGADFIITGEVLGQRPFSQMRDKMSLTMREAGLEGRLLRPLSAKLLEPTIAEIEGLVDRVQLEGIAGRSRKRQLELAAEFGLDDYPAPAGGCLLTDPEYSKRLQDLFTNHPKVTSSDLNLLRVGRHFRPSPDTKIIVGRDEQDNNHIAANVDPSDVVVEVLDAGSPLTLVRGAITDESLRIACALTARYCSSKHQSQINVHWRRNGAGDSMTVAPMSDDELERLRV